MDPSVAHAHGGSGYSEEHRIPGRNRPLALHYTLMTVPGPKAWVWVLYWMLRGAHALLDSAVGRSRWAALYPPIAGEKGD